jgi:hypothetical protein
MYMQESNKPYETKTRHNLKQLIGWLKAWKRGQPLKGKVGGNEVSIGFQDVDHVLGLSIVDGGEIWCEYHRKLVIARCATLKLSGCATLTGSVMAEFSKTLASPRDIVACLDKLRASSQMRFDEDEILTDLREGLKIEIAAKRAHFELYRGIENLEALAVQEVIQILKWAKTGLADRLDVSAVGADLRLADLLWFALGSIALANRIALPGQAGNSWAKLEQKTGVYLFRLGAPTRLEVATENVHSLAGPEPGIGLIAAYDLGRAVPMRMATIGPRTGTSHLEMELQALRTACLA